VPSVFFDAVVKEISGHESFEPALAFVRVLEELVDHAADLLEGSGVDLDDASHIIFRPGKRSKLSHEAAMLRQLMIRTGRTSERMARIHYTLVCLDRMAKFTQERQPGAAVAGRRDRHHQYRPERSDEGSDHRLGGRHPAGPGRRHLWHELQGHAGI
jgi:hypothetical protein